jgi:predicted DNA-binding transcriptional regulator YafY
LEDGRFKMKFVTPHYDYFARWLMSFGNGVEIVAPSELQGIAATIAKELLEHHSAPFLVD